MTCGSKNSNYKQYGLMEYNTTLCWTPTNISEKPVFSL